MTAAGGGRGRFRGSRELGSADPSSAGNVGVEVEP